MVNAAFCLLIMLSLLFMGSTSPAPLTDGNDSSDAAPGMPRNVQRIEILLSNRSEEVVPGLIRQLDKLDRLKTVTTERLGSAVGRVHASLSYILRLKDELRRIAGSTLTRLNAGSNKRPIGPPTRAENTTRRGVVQNTSAAEKHDDADGNESATIGYEAYIDELIRGGFADFEYSTAAPSVEHGVTGIGTMLEKLFVPADRTGFSSTGCIRECHSERDKPLNGFSGKVVQTNIKPSETTPRQRSESRKSYAKRQAPDVLAFTSELDEEDNDTNTKDYFVDDYDEAKGDRNGQRPGIEDYAIQRSDNTYVVNVKHPVNFTREMKSLERTVGFYASTVLELLPYVRQGYLNNKFTDEEIEALKNMFGSMWALINNTELIDKITKLSNISDAEANEEIARAFRETETRDTDKTLVRKTRSVSRDGRKSKPRHSSVMNEHRKRSERKRTGTKPIVHVPSPEATRHRRKHKRKHANVQQSNRPKSIDRKRSKRRRRSHGEMNATIVSEAAAILALLAEDGGHIQLDDPGEDDYYDDDYAYDDYYEERDPYYYEDEEAGEDEDVSAELAEYYSNHDDPSVRELITLASRHRDRKAKNQTGLK